MTFSGPVPRPPRQPVKRMLAPSAPAKRWLAEPPPVGGALRLALAQKPANGINELRRRRVARTALKTLTKSILGEEGRVLTSARARNSCATPFLIIVLLIVTRLAARRRTGMT
jgi:hypothetical protein